MSTDRVEIGDRERTVLREVGTTIANATDSIRTHELVHADSVVELELEVSDRADVLVDLSAEHGCRVKVEGHSFTSSEGIVCYLSISAAPSDAVVDFLVTSDAIGTCRVVDDRGDTALVEATVEHSSVVLTLLEAGGSVRDLFVEGGQAHVVVEAPPSRNLRTLLETVQEDFEDTSLVSKRTVERSYESTEGFRSALDAELTERQHAVLSSAYSAGYFDWPRDSTAEEVADSLGIASPTFHEHLREGLRKLVGVYFDESE